MRDNFQQFGNSDIKWAFIHILNPFVITISKLIMFLAILFSLLKQIENSDQQDDDEEIYEPIIPVPINDGEIPTEAKETDNEIQLHEDIVNKSIFKNISFNKQDEEEMMEFYRDTMVDDKYNRINENTITESNSQITQAMSGTQKNNFEQINF